MELFVSIDKLIAMQHLLVTDKHSTLPHGHVYSTRHPEPNRIDFASAFEWFAAGWRMFAAQPGQWMLMALIAFLSLAIITTFAVPRVPVFGPLIGPIVLALLAGGMLSAAEHQEQGETIRFEYLFDGMRRHAANLVLVGVFYSIPLVLLSVLTTFAMGGGLLVGLFGSQVGDALHGVIGGLVTLLSFILVSWVIFVPLYLCMILALIHAPALIMFRNCASLDAMRLSLKACLRNLFAMLFFGLLLYIFFILALAPAGLGILLFMPVTIGALRRAYLDIFGAAAPRAVLVAPTEETPS